MQKIRFKRGGADSIPILDPGEPYVSLDTGKLYMGGSAGNFLIGGGVGTFLESIDFEGSLTVWSNVGFSAFVHTVFRSDSFDINEDGTSIDFAAWDDGGNPGIHVDATAEKVGFGIFEPDARFHFRESQVPGAAPDSGTSLYLEKYGANFLQIRAHPSALAGVYIGRSEASGVDTGIIATSANQLLLVANGGSAGAANAHTVATLYDGIQVGFPTGNDKGQGTINLSGDIYKNNTAYTSPDYVFEKHYTGEVVEHADKIGSHNYKGKMSIPELKEYTKEHWQLPYKEESYGLFDGSDWLLARVEEMALYIIELHDRVKELEERLDE